MMFIRYLLVLCLVLCIGSSTSSEEKEEDKDLASDLILLGLIKKYYSLFYPTSADGVCGDHSMQYKQGVKDLKLWALKMFDSSTKIPEGFLWGNINELGIFDECVGVSAPDAGYGTFTGKHCYVFIHPKPKDTSLAISKEDNDLKQMIQKYLHTVQSQLKGNHAVGLHDSTRAASEIPDFPSFIDGFRWSYCVPSSCSPAEVTKHMTDIIEPLGFVVTVVNDDCHTTEGLPYVWVDWFCLSIMILLVLLAVGSTTYDLLVTDKASRRPILLSFSLYKNGKSLLDTSTPGGDVLTAVHGIRFLSITWVVFCHQWVMVSNNPNPSLDFYLDFISDPGRMYIRSGALSVDSFFLLSGMLVSYIFLKEMEKGTSFNIPMYYLQRYLRLTPAMAMMILFQVSMIYHFGSGPLWNNALWEGENCKINWWEDLLYIQNYYTIRPFCLFQTWYLAVDMQLFWLSPLVLWPLWKWPKIGKPFLGFLIAASLATVFAISYVKEAHVGAGVQGNMTHMRTAVWLIGIALGYILHNTKKNAPVLKKWMVVVGWAAGLFLTVGNVYLAAPFITTDIGEYNQGWHAFLLAIFRPAFGLGLGWIIYACARGYGGFINSFLSWSFFIPLSRLSYCIYLIHLAVTTVFLANMKNLMYVSDIVVIPQFLANMVINTGVAAILSLLVEVPAINITKTVFARSAPPKKPEKKVELDVEDAKQN